MLGYCEKSQFWGASYGVGGGGRVVLNFSRELNPGYVVGKYELARYAG